MIQINELKCVFVFSIKKSFFKCCKKRDAEKNYNNKQSFTDNSIITYASFYYSWYATAVKKPKAASF